MNATTTLPIPDLDNDEIKYRFSKSGKQHGFNAVYYIERKINDGPFVTIGTVYKARDNDWRNSALWYATLKGEDGWTVQGDSRDAATKALEHRLQPSEYWDRKHQEYLDDEAQRAAEKLVVINRHLARIDAAEAGFPQEAIVPLIEKMRAHVATGGSMRTTVFTIEEVLALIEDIVTP